MEAEHFSAWYFNGDKLLAVDCINAPKDIMVAKKMLTQGNSPDKTAVADAEQALI